MNEAMLIERSVDLIQTDVDGELVALDVNQGNCFGFNATATRVWQMLGTPQSVGAIVDALMAEYSVDRETCEAAVIELVGEFQARGLVRSR